MLTLGLDSSEGYGELAAWEGDRLIGVATTKESLRHAEELLPMMEHLLKTHDLDKAQIDLISVNLGPGSFTGLRIGLATAKGLCQALEIPLVGVNGTFSYRSRLESERYVCVIIPDRRDLYYVQWYTDMEAAGAIEVVAERDLLKRIKGTHKEVTTVGSGAERLRNLLESMHCVKLASKEMNRPSAASIARLGANSYDTDRLYDLDPIYVEPAIMGRSKLRGDSYGSGL
jgi:tRNA threonylcarbamoyladenosine biosynthesis protein TsaB